MKTFAADALLFDLGGVVIDIDFNRAFARWATLAQSDEQLVRERFSPDGAYIRHEIGEIGIEEYLASLRDSLGIDLTHDQLLDGWNAIFIGEVPGIAALLARAAQRVPLYAFTNTNPAHAAFWASKFRDAVKHFKKIYVSSSIGLRKPDDEAFAFVVKDIGVPADRILFFDDSPHNIEGARTHGLQTVLVTSPSDVAGALEALGL